jgi:hypothetical protein
LSGRLEFGIVPPMPAKPTPSAAKKARDLFFLVDGSS